MASTESQKNASKKYRDKAYDTVSYVMPKGYKETIRLYADGQGLSLNRFIDTAVKTYMRIIDLKKEKQGN